MSILVTPGSPISLSPDTTVNHPFDALAHSLLNYTTTLVASENLSDRAKIRIPYTSQGELPEYVAEGDDIPETDTKVQELTISTRKLATIKTISNELLGHTNAEVNTEGMALSQVTEDLITRADMSLFSPHHLESLTALEGITEAGELGTNLDPFVDAIANTIDQGGREEELSIVASPKAWAALTKLKDSTNGTAEIKVRTLIGVALFVSRHLSDAATGTENILIYDRSNVVAGASPIRLDRDTSHAFKRDATAFRATYRLGVKVFKPARVTRITIPTAAV